MQHEGATKVEFDLLEVLRWNEAAGCSVEHTTRSVAMSNALEELQRLRGSNEELLAALKGLEYQGGSEPGRFCDHPDYPNHECPRCLAASVAISKAEGRSE